MVAEGEVVVASMSCSLSLVVPGGGVLVRGVFRRRRERRRNRAGGQPGGPGGEDVFQRAKKECAGEAGSEGCGPRPGKDLGCPERAQREPGCAPARACETEQAGIRRGPRHREPDGNRNGMDATAGTATPA